MGFFNKIFGGDQENNQSIEWKSLRSSDDLAKAIAASEHLPVVIFKHSTRCSISSMAKSRLERAWDFEANEAPAMYFLDLIAYRDISNQIADDLGVRHESPQLLLIEDGQVTYHTSHSAISVEGLHQALGN
jgi:bacillithiol system protein YtxJ